MVEISSKPQQYMVAQAQSVPAGVEQMSFEQIQLLLESAPDIEVHRTIQSKNQLNPLSVLLAETPKKATPGIIIASMPESTAQVLARSPQVQLEVDHLLNYFEPNPIHTTLNPSNLIPFGASATYDLQIVNEKGKGINQASVFIYGGAYPVNGITNAEGKVSITLQNQNSADPQALYVNPQSGYWNIWVDNPQLDEGDTTIIPLTPITNTFPNLSKEETYGWGQIAMGLDKIPSECNGEGITCCIIDSGAAVTHPDLKHLKKGLDLTVSPPADSWSDDTVAHGSHCAGIITGSVGTNGIRGFAPDAEVHIIKIFLGGRFSSLLDALDYCIENQVDVVNMSLGSPNQSNLLLDKLSEAKQQGIACIVAAGNSGGEVQFPGTSPDVITVSAIGKIGTFPGTSHHARQVGPTAQESSGASSDYFSASFTCYGPEVDLCGPGVAILSSVPPKGYGLWDGTSMAAPHISGAAALILAHHPDFKEKFKERNSDRVDHLRDILVSSSESLDVEDPERVGAGMPNIERALQISLPSNSQDASNIDTTELWKMLLRSWVGDQFSPEEETPQVRPEQGFDQLGTLMGRLIQELKEQQLKE